MIPKLCQAQEFNAICHEMESFNPDCHWIKFDRSPTGYIPCLIPKPGYPYSLVRRCVKWLPGGQILLAFTRALIRRFSRSYQTESLFNSARTAEYLFNFFKSSSQSFLLKNRLALRKCLYIRHADTILREQWLKMLDQLDQVERTAYQADKRDHKQSVSHKRKGYQQPRSQIDLPQASCPDSLLGKEENLSQIKGEKTHLVIEDLAQPSPNVSYANQKQLVSLDKEIQEKTDVLKEIHNQLIELKKEKHKMADTVFLCYDNQKLVFHMDLLQAIPFFKRYFANRLCFTHSLVKEEQLKQGGLLEEGVGILNKKEEVLHPNLRFFFDFSDYSIETLQLFLDLIEKKVSLNEVQNVTLLYKLYLLLNYIGEEGEDWQGSCLNQLKGLLSAQDALHLLSVRNLLEDDPLIQHALHLIAARFYTLICDPAFALIHHAYLVELLKRDDLIIGGEYNLLAEIHNKWIIKQPNQDIKWWYHSSMSEEKMIDQIRLEYLDSNQGKLIADILSEEDLSKWNCIWQEPLRRERPTRFKELLIEPLNLNELQLTWRLFQVSSKLSKPLQHQISTDSFQFSSYKWKLNLEEGERYQGYKVLSILCEDKWVEFDFQLKIQDFIIDSQQAQTLSPDALITWASSHPVYPKCKVAHVFIDPKRLEKLCTPEDTLIVSYKITLK
jgi:hypothetical protein